MMDESKLNKMYTDLATATRKYQSAAAAASGQRSTIERLRYQEIADGQMIGKNADEREANFRAKYPDQFMALANLEWQESEAKGALELAKLEVDHCKQLIRLAEIEAFGYKSDWDPTAYLAGAEA